MSATKYSCVLMRICVSLYVTVSKRSNSVSISIAVSCQTTARRTGRVVTDTHVLMNFSLDKQIKSKANVFALPVQQQIKQMYLWCKTDEAQTCHAFLRLCSLGVNIYSLLKRGTSTCNNHEGSVLTPKCVRSSSNRSAACRRVIVKQRTAVETITAGHREILRPAAGMMLSHRCLGDLTCTMFS